MLGLRRGGGLLALNLVEGHGNSAPKGLVGLAVTKQGLAGSGQRLGPLRQVSRRCGAGLGLGDARLAKRVVHVAGRRLDTLLVLLRDPGPTAAAEQRGGHHRRGQGELDPPPLLFLGGTRLGLDPLELGPPQLVLHASEIGRDPPGDRAGLARAVLALAGQAVSRQGDQFPIRCACIEPFQCIGQIALRRLALDLARGPAGEGRLSREDLAEDRAQREDVGPLVDHVDLAASLLGGHVRGGAQDRSGVREVRIIRSAPRRGDHGLLRIGLAGRVVVNNPTAG